MKIYIEDDNGIKHEINKIEGLGDGNNLLLQLKCQTIPLPHREFVKMQDYFTNRIGKTVTILPNNVDVIGTI